MPKARCLKFLTEHIRKVITSYFQEESERKHLVWERSLVDPRNQNGIVFSLRDEALPTLKNADDFLNFYELSGPWIFANVGVDNRIWAQVSDTSDEQKKIRLFHSILFNYMGPFYDDSDESKDYHFLRNPDFFRGNPSSDELLFDGWDNLIREISESTNSPVVYSRCMSVLLFLGNKRDKKLISDTWKALWQEARIYLRYGDYCLSYRGIQAMNAACFIASNYYQAIDNIDDFIQTVRWIIYEKNLPNVILDDVSYLLIHFLGHNKWKNDYLKEVSSGFCQLLNGRILLAKEEKNFSFIESLTEKAVKICESCGEKNAARRIKDRSDEFLLEISDSLPGGIGNGIAERMLKRDPDGNAAASKNELIQNIKKHTEVIVSGMKPITLASISVNPKESVILAEISKVDDLIDKIQIVTNYPGIFPGNHEIEQALKEEANSSSLWAAISRVKIQENRPVGGTQDDPEFRQKEVCLLLFRRYFSSQLQPALDAIVSEDDFVERLTGLFLDRIGGLENQKEQLRAGLTELKEGKYIQALAILTYMFEGILKKYLQMKQVDTDRQKKSDGLVIQKELLEKSIDKLVSAGWCGEAIRVCKLVFTESGSGLNFRNNLYHGLSKDSEITQETSLLVFFFILFFLDIS